ncbi:MAG TPA: hypothetical protein VHZ29_02930 [Rhizomicrobium sp.]|jgi:hypothetical protein|nr:hypothetical protein [Rhizomicrobium sp.]
MAQYDLRTWSDVASIATFVLAALGSALGLWCYMRFQWDLRQKRLKLENYLKAELGGDDLGRRSVLRIISAIGLTETEIIQASFRSNHVARHRFYDEQGMTRTILFQYKN